MPDANGAKTMKNKSHCTQKTNKNSPATDGSEEKEVLRLERLHFAYRDRQKAGVVLDNVSLSLNQGQKIGLYGPNGSGKTTLLRCITGLNKPQKGRILFHGKVMAGEADFRPLRLAIGFVLQNADDQLFFPTVLEDVAFGPLNLGFGEDDARMRAADTLKSLGLDGFEHRLTHRLSGGEKKLITLACVLAMQPEALLLDEPTGGLDMESQARFTELLQGLPTARITISHDWDFLTRVSNDFCTIEEGHLSWRAPLIAHMHAHPFGDEPHTHGDI